MLIMLIATIILCLLFTMTVILGNKKNPTIGLHNLPLDIQERVHSMPEYKGKIERILSTKERIIKKFPALIILLALFSGVICMAGARSFVQGAGYAFGLWAVVKLYVTLALNCGWYAHTPSAWILGTEDMKTSYQNYKFYLSSIPRSLLAGDIIAVIIGGIIVLV